MCVAPVGRMLQEAIRTGGVMQRTRRTVAAIILITTLALLLSACGARQYQSRYGVNIATCCDVDAKDAPVADLMRAAGFKWVRIYVSWEGLQPSGPSIDQNVLAILQNKVKIYTDRGFAIDFTFAGSTPTWANDWSQPRPCSNDQYKDRRKPLPGKFGAFARAMATLFNSSVAAWEVWNEPMNKCQFPGRADEFRYMNEEAFDNIRSVDPGAIVLGSAVNQGQFDAWYTHPNGGNRVLDRPFNAINLHVYGAASDQVAAMNTAHNYRRCTAESYCVEDYWLTEYGFRQDQSADGAVTVTQHCESQSDCKRVMYFAARWDTPSDDVGNVSLLDPNTLQPRASYDWLKTWMNSHEAPLPPAFLPDTLSWSYTGPIAGQHCVLINEPSDAPFWSDNYLCSRTDLGLRWSFAGPIAGMACTQFSEPADPNTWSDNYVCSPVDYGLTWQNYSPPPRDMHCTQIIEPSELPYWFDNWLCYY
jgi:hypothetical protein